MINSLIIDICYIFELIGSIKLRLRSHEKLCRFNSYDLNNIVLINYDI